MLYRRAGKGKRCWSSEPTTCEEWGLEMPVHGIRIDVDGTAGEVELGADSNGVDGALRDVIKCDAVRPLFLAPEIVLWLNEDAIPTGDLALNQRATAIAASHGFTSSPCFGVAVLTGIDGDDVVSLTDEQKGSLLEIVHS